MSGNAPDVRRVFVVHGRNDAVRRAICEFLRTIDLVPVEWNEAVRSTDEATPLVSQILDRGFAQSQAVLVVLTGDDEARLRSEFRSHDDPPYEAELMPQVRQNVLFEAGLAFASHPGRTVVCQVGEVRPFSDIFGRHLVRLNNSATRRQDLAQRLQTAGCVIDLTGTDWHTAGDFEGAAVRASRGNASRSTWPGSLKRAVLAALVVVALGGAYLVSGLFTGRTWLSYSQFQQEFNRRAAAGQYPTHVEGRLYESQEQFRAEWEPLPSGCIFWTHHGLSKSEYDQRNSQLTAEGYSIKSFMRFTGANGGQRYQAVWLKGCD